MIILCNKGILFLENTIYTYMFNHLTPISASYSLYMRSGLDCVLYWQQSADRSDQSELSIVSYRPIRAGYSGHVTRIDQSEPSSLAISWLHPSSHDTAMFLSPYTRHAGRQQGYCNIVYCTLLYCILLYSTVILCTSTLINAPAFWLWINIVSKRSLSRETPNCS